MAEPHPPSVSRSRVGQRICISNSFQIKLLLLRLQVGENLGARTKLELLSLKPTGKPITLKDREQLRFARGRWAGWGQGTRYCMEVMSHSVLLLKARLHCKVTN